MSIFFDDEYDLFNYEREKKNIIDNLEMLKSMTVQEHTLYKKWIECREYKDRYDSAFNTKFNIWKPTDILDKSLTVNEITNLNPKIKLVEHEYEEEDWFNLRIFAHTLEFDANPGRLLKYIIIDENTDKYLGYAALGSDVVSIGTRDKLIGWTRDNKFKDGKLNCIAIGTTIVPTQPLGYNFLGGKLIASLLTTQRIRDDWKNKYGDTLVGLTTTSLYGQGSMYNSIPYWKSLGESAGKVYIKPDPELYEKWHGWIKDNLAEEYNKYIVLPAENNNGPVTGIKQKILTIIMKELKIRLKDYFHGHHRGIYFSPFYTNYKEFLRSEITEDDLIMKERIKKGLPDILKWWKNKAVNRYVKLYDENRIKSEVLYYSKLPFMTWEETKDKFLQDVGR